MDNLDDQEFFVVSSTTNPFQAYLDVDLARGFTHVVVTSACIPKTYYVLPEAATLTIVEAGGPVTVTLAAGNYNVNSFKTLFAAACVSAGCAFTYVLTFPDSATGLQTSKYTFTVSGNGGVQPTFTVNDSYLARVMGFPLSNTQTFAANVLVSSNVVNFQSYDELMIISDMVKNKRSLLQEIYSSANVYNSSIVWTNNSLPLNAKKLNTTSCNVYSFALVTEANELIHLNGCEFSFIIMLFKASNYESVMKQYIAISMLEKEKKKLP